MYKGVYPILPTPFLEDSSLDLDSLKKLILFQKTVGVQGVAILGFLGEAHKLSEEERDIVIRTAIEVAGDELLVWVGVRSLGTAGCIEQARKAEKLGASAVFVAPIAVQNDNAIYNHYKTIHEAIEIPIIIHDYPSKFGVFLSVELIAKLGNDSICQYIKLEEPPVGPKMSKILELSSGNIGIFGGLGGTMFIEELQRGSSGIMTGLAFPEVLVKIYTTFQKDPKLAASIFDRYVSYIRYEFQPQIGLGFRKYIYHKRFIFSTTKVRPPAQLLDNQTINELEYVLSRVGLKLDQNIQIISD